MALLFHGWNHSFKPGQFDACEFVAQVLKALQSEILATVSKCWGQGLFTVPQGFIDF
jgi:hypothetical protein